MKRFPVGVCLSDREQKELTMLLGHYQHDLESEIDALTSGVKGMKVILEPIDQMALNNARRHWKTAEKWVARFNPAKKGKA